MPRDYLKAWLSLTTCAGAAVKRSVLFENDDYIVLKHNSHSSYSGRYLGSGTCGSYAVLFRKADVDANWHDFRYGSPRLAALKQWSGRISPSRVRAECSELGIVFPQLDTSAARD